MSAYYRKVLPADGAQIPARVWNQLLDQAAGQDFNAGSNAPRIFRQADIIKIRNDSGEDLVRFNVLGLNGPLITPATNLGEFQRQVLLSGIIPTVAAHAGRFAILLDPIPDGEIGRAWLAGVCPVQIAVPGGAPVLDFAEVNDGQTGTLLNTTGGSAQVLWAESNSNATQWAIVRFLGDSGGSGRMASVKATGSLSGLYYPGMLYDDDLVSTGIAILVRDSNTNPLGTVNFYTAKKAKTPYAGKDVYITNVPGQVVLSVSCISGTLTPVPGYSL